MNRKSPTLWLMIAVIILARGYVTVRAQTPSWKNTSNGWEYAATLWEAKAMECDGQPHPVICQSSADSQCLKRWRNFNDQLARKLAHAQQPKEVAKVAEAPIVPDKAARAILAEQLAQAKLSIEFQQIQKQIDDSPLGKRIKELQAAFGESTKKMLDASKGVCGDEKAWSLDIEAMRCVLAKPEAAKKE